MARPRTKVTHRDICRQVASISANLRVGNREKAKAHTLLLLRYLSVVQVLPAEVMDALHRSCSPNPSLPTADEKDDK